MHFATAHPRPTQRPSRRTAHSSNGSVAALAQLGERQTEDLKVPGSIPGGGTLPPAVVPKRLRGWTRNPLGSARAGSSPADCVFSPTSPPQAKKTPAVGIEPTTSGSGNRRASIAPRGHDATNGGRSWSCWGSNPGPSPYQSDALPTELHDPGREWSSGRMAPCHGVGPGSIPGSRIFSTANAR